MLFVSMLQYIANIRMPTEKAHGAQIVKTCEAIARLGTPLELIVPKRTTTLTEDPFLYYKIEKNFSIKYVPVLDLIWLGRIGFWIETFSFSFFALVHVLTHRGGVVYSRDEVPLWLISFFAPSVVWESHTGRYNFFTKRLLSAGRTCVVISQGLKSWYEEKSAKATFVVAPDAIDMSAFSHPESNEEARSRLHLPLDKKIVLYIGRLDGWKGVATLLESSIKLSKDIQVVLIGGEPEEIKKLSFEYPNVLFVGARPYSELADNQAAADVLVLPNTGKDIISARFTSPMKLFSYMAAGKPIIASDLPSIREVLNEKNAVFFKADDPNSLRDAIENLLKEPARMGDIAAEAKQEVAKYTWDARAKTILSATEK